MASIEKHCADTAHLGDFRHVHEWLDKYAVKDGMLCGNHHKWRHNKEAVEYLRWKWGDRDAEAAEIHIRRDMREMGQDDRVQSGEEIAEWQGKDRWYRIEDVFNDCREGL